MEFMQQSMGFVGASELYSGLAIFRCQPSDPEQRMGSHNNGVTYYWI